jgi:hypothetical protein
MNIFHNNDQQQTPKNEIPLVKYKYKMSGGGGNSVIAKNPPKEIII